MEGAIGCQKGVMDDKPNTNIVVPSSIDDIQKILDNTAVLNNYPLSLRQLGADEYYFTFSGWQKLIRSSEKNAHIWAKDIYNGERNIPDWNDGFKGIYYANVALESLNNIPTGRIGTDWNRLKGSALFYRAYHYFNLLLTFTLPFDKKTASTDLGLPIRAKADINEIIQRSSIQQTYNFILNDLKGAIELLPTTIDPLYQNRPSKVACFALLSRIYLSIFDYENAENYADKTLGIYNTLIDYNSLSTSTFRPFSNNNPELLLWGISNGYSSMNNGQIQLNTNIDTLLIKLYEPNDLRKGVYFNKNSFGDYNIKSGYQGTYLQPFAGIATDEIYLIKSECLARRRETLLSLNMLNTLLEKRYKSGTFVRITATTPEEALSKILLERRKELVWRGLRWLDLRRLNKEGANITIQRMLNGEIFTLSPNSLRYAFPIPEDEIALSGIEQNSR